MQQEPIVAGVLSPGVFGMQAPLAPVVIARHHADKPFVYAQAKALRSWLTSQLAALTPCRLNRLCWGQIGRTSFRSTSSPEQQH